MARSCAPPKTVRVRDYLRKAGRRRKKPAAAITGYTCRQDGTGRTCGITHRTMASAVKHTRSLDRSESMQRARNLNRAQARKVKFKRWHAIKIG